MLTIRKFAYLSFFLACTHLVFGAIVRISGSGMGCGNHWPLCDGMVFPPLERPDLIIELTHRYLAAFLLLSLVVLFAVAWTRRVQVGVGGGGGVLRAAGLAMALGFGAALLGAVTVKLGNAPFATLAHWTVAMSLVATVVATVVRSGGFGGESMQSALVTRKTERGSAAGAAVALVAVVMGGLTAKFPGASVACSKFPLCGPNPDVVRGAVDIQLTHRGLAFLLVLHLIGLAVSIAKRREPALIRRMSVIAAALGVLQLVVAGAMIGMHLPPVLRSLHEATGVSVWVATFALAYLARLGRDGPGVLEPVVKTTPRDLVGSAAATVRAPYQSMVVIVARGTEI